MLSLRMLRGGCRSSYRICSILQKNPKLLVENQPVRMLALTAPVNQESVMNVFDRTAKRKQRNRTAFLENYSVYDYIKDEVRYWFVFNLTCIIFYCTLMQYAIGLNK